ncbi:hypothetical protein [Trueperella sp. LYQ143]|uniref:hypothetical protein n=1 Tax=unclassified Trueperella TaxID=2630174 RepID=UPI003983B923
MSHSDDDIDARFAEITRGLPDPQAYGFRTWRPPSEDEIADEMDEAEEFHPDLLPPAQPSAPPAQPFLARFLFGVVALIIAVYCAQLFHLIELSQTWRMILPLGGALAFAAGVFVSSPWRHNEDDDGTRL